MRYGPFDGLVLPRPPSCEPPRPAGLVPSRSKRPGTSYELRRVGCVRVVIRNPLPCPWERVACSCIRVYPPPALRLLFQLTGEERKGRGGGGGIATREEFGVVRATPFPPNLRRRTPLTPPSCLEAVPPDARADARCQTSLGGAASDDGLVLDLSVPQPGESVPDPTRGGPGISAEDLCTLLFRAVDPWDTV